MVDDDPLPALKAAVADGDVVEVAVVTYPHAIEDTFHRDWASRAASRPQVPVLHLYRHAAARLDAERQAGHPTRGVPPVVMSAVETERSASVGASRAARIAG